MKRLYILAILSVLVLAAIVIAGCAGVQRQIDAEPYVTRGLAYHEKGHYDEAIADYSKAIEIIPRYYKAYFNKATTCERAGYIREAIEAYIGLIMYVPSKHTGQIKHARERIKELDLKLPQRLKLASHRSSENVRHSDRTRILGE